MKKYSIAALIMCGIMTISGCNNGNNNNSNNNSSASVSDTGSSFGEKNPDGRYKKPEKTVIIKSTEKGNSGEVTIESGDLYAVMSIKDYGDIKFKLYPDEAPYAVQNFVDLANAGKYDGRNFHRIKEDFMAQGGSGDGNGSGGDSFEGGSFRSEINTCLRHYYGALCYACALGNISDQFYIVNNKKKQEDVLGSYDISQYNYTKYAEYYKQMADAFGKGTEGYDYYMMQYAYFIESAEGSKAMTETITDSVKEKYKSGGTPSLDGGYTVFGQAVEGFDVIDKITAVEKVQGSDNTVSKPATDIIIDSVKIYTAE